MAVFGALIGFVGLVMDTSVPTRDGGRIHNLGLLREQQNAMTLGGVLFIGGIILLVAARPSRDRESRSRTPQFGERACPYCAEIIKTAAIKCRFCGSDLLARRKDDDPPVLRDAVARVSKDESM